MFFNCLSHYNGWGAQRLECTLLTYSTVASRASRAPFHVASLRSAKKRATRAFLLGKSFINCSEIMKKRPATLGEFKPKSQKNQKKGLSSLVFLNQKKYQKNRKRPLLVCVFEHEISNFKVDFLPIF